MITLILGGEKSGKSALALRCLEQSPVPHFFVGTAQARDMEMRRRINEHRKNRPPHIPSRESDMDLAAVLREESAKGGTILVDSLDFWLFSCIQANQEQQRKFDLLEALGSGLTADLILVSLEVGLGPIQAAAQTRVFVRSVGLLNQELATLAQEVFLVVAGLPLQLKGRS
jgi:adenosylcobinamide kinase / adenosylcobinamide-phosphate guanylyltransferase